MFMVTLSSSRKTSNESELVALEKELSSGVDGHRKAGLVAPHHQANKAMIAVRPI